MESKIQILSYRDVLDTRTGKSVFSSKVVATGSSVKNLFDNLETILNVFPEEERYNLHYTNFFVSEGQKRLFEKQNIIAIDIDDINQEKFNSYLDVVFSFLPVDRNKCSIVSSGHGIHIIIELDYFFYLNDLPKLQRSYSEMCRQLSAEIYNNGLAGLVDPIRLNQSATLRLPGTINRKKGMPDVLCKLVENNLSPQEFDLCKLFPVADVLEQDFKSYHVDTPAVLAGCKFLKYLKEEPNSITEPQWHAGISVLAYLPEIGEQLCHTYSQEAKCYDPEETQFKHDQAKSFGIPRTCEGVNDTWHRCNECPHYKKIKTPLQIRGADFISTEKDGFHFITHTAKGGVIYKPDFPGLMNFMSKTKGPFINDVETGDTYLFNGKYWEEMREGQILNFATSNFNPTATNSMRAEFLGLVKSSNVAPIDFLNKDNEGHINFGNGVLRLRDKVLLPHSTDFGFTYCLPYNYDPHATCPNFDAMMDAITLGDASLQNILDEFIGYSISGRPNAWIQKMLVLVGGGSNGKSTFLNVVRKLAGEKSYSALTIASMCKEESRYSMWGKLFNISFDEEPKALKKGGINIFKAITAGDPLNIRRLYANTITAPINTKLIIACNTLPETDDHTHAVYRRMLIVPFNATFSGENENKSITDKIYPEMSGIYNRVLKGLDRLILTDGRFTDSKVAKKALLDYKYETAIYQRFFDDTFKASRVEGDFVAVEEIMSEFKNWCSLNNEFSTISSLKLCKELKNLNLLHGDSCSGRVGNATKRGYKGIKKITQLF